MEHNIKLYQVNLDHFELIKFKVHSEVVHFIVDEHRKATKKNNDVGQKIEPLIKEGNKFYLYKYDNKEKTSTWGDFFPSEIVEDEDFTTRRASFVLFSSTPENLYCIIGGSGIIVVKRWINQIFGIDLFERIASPEQDIITTISSRGISGNLNSQTVTFRREQKLIDSLSLTRLPTKATIQLREELIADVFSFLGIATNEKILVEIGSYFHIKMQLSFEQFNDLINVTDKILTIDQYTSLSAFRRIKNKYLIDNNLRKLLYRY